MSLCFDIASILIATVERRYWEISRVHCRVLLRVCSCVTCFAYNIELHDAVQYCMQTHQVPIACVATSSCLC